MKEVSAQTQMVTMDKSGSVVLDIISLGHPDKCSGSPKVTKVLSRKGSNRMEKQNGECLEVDDATKKIVVKVICSQIDQMKQAQASNRALVAVTAAANMTSLSDAGDVRNKKFSHLRTINPRNILFFFAAMSTMGTMLLIYFTLALNQSSGD